MKRRKFVSVIGLSALASGTSFFGYSWFKKLTSEPFLLSTSCSKIGFLANKRWKVRPTDLDISQEAMKNLIADEYASGKTVFINDWLYSETEAKMAGHRYAVSHCKE